MRKGFTKIPNDILDQPWATNPTAVYLYTWLTLNADNNGQIMTSRADLAERTGLTERQLRTALEKLLATKYVTKQSTKFPTKFATTLTVEYLTSYKDAKNKNDQVSDQVNDQASDQPRAYKNDNINIMSFSKTNKDTPLYPPKGEGEYDWSVVPDNLKPIVEEWLKYKREKKQSYKPTGFKSFSKLLNEYSGGDERKARMIIEQSMANNWAGIFELKTNNDGTDRRSGWQSNGHPTNEQVVAGMLNNIATLNKSGGGDGQVPF